jgi:predicted O-methyltransferase YrrM
VTTTADPGLTAPAHAPRSVLATVHQAFLARAIYTVVELGVVDALAHGPRSCAELARALGVAAGPLHQVLRGTASSGLLRSRGGAGADEVFALTDAGKTLLPGHPSCTRDLVLMMQGPTVLDCLEALPERVRSGRTGPEVAHGRTWFENLRADDELAASFDRMMVAIHGGEYGAVAAAYDMSWAGTVVDVGGGTGGLTVALLEANAHLRGVVHDLPDVAARAERALRQAGLAHRAEASGGSFFDHVPRGADAYLLSYVLHDWNDDDCLRILGTVAAAMTPGARLLVVENVLPAGDEPHPGRTLDLLMATLTHGRERTEEEYRRLLTRAGLRLRRVVPTASPVSVLEAVPEPVLRAAHDPEPGPGGR